ncbi:MAG: Hsp33 family molecular chaperone HslO [Treponemataceae bacterium]
MIYKEYTDKELENFIEALFPDKMTIFILADGRYRGALFHGTRFVNRMRLQHNLGILETQILGAACISGALLIPTMKGKEQLNFRYDTNGPAAGFCVNADSAGYVRGYLLQNPIPIDKPLESWDLSGFFGEGTLSISRLPEGSKEFQTGTVEIVHKNIAKDLTWYFEQSEQIKTAFSTSILMDKQGRVTGAGGMFLQKMPDFGGKIKKSKIDSEMHDDITPKIEHAFNCCPSLGQWFSEGGDMEDIIFGLFREFNPNVALTRDIKFDCGCTKENFIRRVRQLNSEELSDIKKNGDDPLEIICHNCGSIYHISLSEI